MLTMEEIAKMAGVSQATVSRVINGSAAVSLKTRLTVMEYVRKYNYLPNITAQGLIKQQSFLIGVILPNITVPYFAVLMKNIDSETFSNGYNIVYYNTVGEIESEREALNALKSRRVDGILIVPADSNAKHIKDLKNINIPTVVMMHCVEEVDSVSISQYTGGELIAEHFIQLGYRKIGYIGLENDEKFLGLKSVLEKEGINFEYKNLIDYNEFEQITAHNVKLEIEKHFKKFGNLDIDALFACNDSAAFSAIKCLEEFGYKIPDDIAIAGFGNTYLSYELKPELTSVTQPVGEIAKAGLNIIFDKIHNKNKEHVNIVYKPKLIIRESSFKRI